MNKKAWLDTLFYDEDYGNQVETLELASVFQKDGEAVWSKWVKYFDLIGLTNDDLRFFARANNRTILKGEIVIDLDLRKNETHEELKLRCEKALGQLDQKGINYMAWFSGSVGYHIHIFSRMLRNYEHRDEYRAWFVRHLTGDDFKAKPGRVMIALEYDDHWKTGRPKTLLINKNNGVNDTIPLV